ncbi:MAG: ABC transporter permease [Clostridia bacterium]|nr:ABC transporter permease [Clostridia bacterium]
MRNMATIWKRFCRHRLAEACLVILLVLGTMAILAPLIAPYSPTAPDMKAMNKPPSAAHILGTDKIGRDMYSRVLYGMRVSLMVGALATVISTAVGVALGLVAGYFGGWADRLIMSFTDMVMSFPYILLVLVAAAIFQPGLWTIILILGLVNWPGVCRLVRGNVLSLRETNFIRSDVTAGMPRRFILLSEILPNTLAPVLVYGTSVFALSILDEAALSFLGQGVQPPMASLGNLLGAAQSLSTLTGKPWLWLPAGVVVIVLVVCINLVGDALRDAMDPRNSQ